METIMPASTTLQGIPPELRTEIYTHLAIIDPCEVSARQFVKISKASQSSDSDDLRNQSQSAIAPHPLTQTCRQMYTEFNHVLATTAGQPYNLIVNNLDIEQLALFHHFIKGHCSFSRSSDEKIQPLPLLYKEVALHLKVDGNALQSIEAYIEGMKMALPYRPGLVIDALAEVKLLPNSSSSVSEGGVANETESLTESQAESAVVALRAIRSLHAFMGFDVKAMELMLAHFTDMVDSHKPIAATTTTTDEIGDA